MKLSVTQAVIVVTALVCLTIGTALGKVDGATLAVVLATLAGNSLGYVNGKGVGVHEGTAHTTAAAKTIIDAAATARAVIAEAAETAAAGVRP